jgi:small-conductance mechanosensitive channel
MGVAIVIIVLLILAVRHVFERRYASMPHRQSRLQLVLLALSFIGILVVIILSPLSDAQQGQLLSLIGILLSAAIALSSTTFVGNAMAGIMLRAVRSFKMGDFICIGDHFGRISERGLFHIEIQNEDRDLTTLPNLYLVTNPAKVTRASGTIISADVSLGYDVPRTSAEKLLLEAAGAAELSDAFVRIIKLGDFSVSYRVAGLLTEVKKLLSARSLLHEMMLDKLHEAGVEIVSPNFMNTRALGESKLFVPRPVRVMEPAAEEPSPEAMAFDKADEAESTEKLQERHDGIGKEIETLKERIKKAENEAERDMLQKQVDQLDIKLKQLAESLQAEMDKPEKE